MTDEQLSRDMRALEVDEEPNPAFADALFAQLEDEVVAKRGPGATWLLLAAAALIAAVAVGAALGSGLVKLPFLIAEASPTATPSASPPVTASASPSVEPTPRVTPQPSPTPNAAIAVDTVVRIVVTDLALRASPGLDGARQGALAGGGTPAFAVAGPVLADGYEWWQLSGLGIPPHSGCSAPPASALDQCPGWFGWVAAREVGGAYWLEPTSLVCPSSPMNLETFALARGNVERLACNLEGTITVRAWYDVPENSPESSCPSREHASAWLYCSNLTDVTVWTDETVSASISLQVHRDSASEPEMPAPGRWVEIVGHLDDPGAQGCDDVAAADDGAFPQGDLAVLTCRTELVMDSVTAVGGPF